MFRIITGNPGSEKSYYAVNYLRKFCDYDKVYETLNLNHDVLLVTNVDGIKVNYMHFDDFVNQGLLNIDKTREYLLNHNYKRLVMIVDEANKFFSSTKDNDVFFWFEYHRHLGIDVFLIVHTVSTLPRRIADLSEYLIEAHSRTNSLVGFAYNCVDPRNGMKIFSIHLKKDQTVFKLYKSFEIDEAKDAKPKKMILRKAVIAVCIMMLGFGFIIYKVKSGTLFNSGKDTKKEEVKKEKSNKIEIKDKNKEPEKLTKSESTQVTSQAQNQPAAVIKKKPTFVKIQASMNIKPHDNITGVAKVGEETYVFYE